VEEVKVASFCILKQLPRRRAGELVQVCDCVSSMWYSLPEI
jgi:hypothetical protein